MINLVNNSAILYLKINFLDTFSTFMMPEYEKNNIVEYTNASENKLIFGNTNDDKMTDLIKSIV